MQCGSREDDVSGLQSNSSKRDGLCGLHLEKTHITFYWVALIYFDKTCSGGLEVQETDSLEKAQRKLHTNRWKDEWKVVEFCLLKWNQWKRRLDYRMVWNSNTRASSLGLVEMSTVTCTGKNATGGGGGSALWPCLDFATAINKLANSH